MLILFITVWKLQLNNKCCLYTIFNFTSDLKRDVLTCNQYFFITYINGRISVYRVIYILLQQHAQTSSHHHATDMCVCVCVYIYALCKKPNYI